MAASLLDRVLVSRVPPRPLFERRNGVELRGVHPRRRIDVAAPVPKVERERTPRLLQRPQ